MEFIKDQEREYAIKIMQNRQRVEMVASRQIQFFAKTTLAFNKYFVFTRSAEIDEKIMNEINTRAFKMINVLEEATKKTKKSQKG